MRSVIIIFAIAIIFSNVYAQSVGVGTTTPNSSAILDISSTTKGMLMPRMTTAQRNSIASPSEGLMIMNTDDKCIDRYLNGAWTKECDSKKTTAYTTDIFSWVNRGQFYTEQRSEAVGFAINSLGYICTGQDNSVLKNDLWEYNPSTNVWTQKANFIGTQRRQAIGFVLNNKAYVGTGSDLIGVQNDIYEYNPITNTWAAMSAVPSGGRMDAVAFSSNGKGMVGTGHNGSVHLRDFHQFTPPSVGFPQGTWAIADSFPSLRSNAVAMTINGYGYVGTGKNSTNTYKDFWMYDHSINDWIQKADMSGNARESACAFVVNNIGYIGTGLAIGNPSTLTSDFFSYDPTTNSWSAVTDFMGAPRRDAATFDIGNLGYVIHGDIGNINNSDLNFYSYSPFGQSGQRLEETSNSISLRNNDWTLEGGKLYTTLGNVDTRIRGSLTIDNVLKGRLKFASNYDDKIIFHDDDPINFGAKYKIGINDTSFQLTIPSNQDNFSFYEGGNRILNLKKGGANGVAIDPDNNNNTIMMGRIADGSSMDIGLGIGGKSTTTWCLGANSGAFLLGVGNNSNNGLQTAFQVSTNRNVFIVPVSGNVGIGTNAPTSKLSVNGTASKPGGGTWDVFSDIRVKKNIVSYAKGLDEILRINPVTFQYNEKSGYTDLDKSYVGIIAQEIEKILPSTITEVKTNYFDNQKVFDASELTFTIVNAIKELHKQNEELKMKNEKLEKSFFEFKAEVHKEIEHIKSNKL